MEIVDIFAPYLYAIRYNKEGTDEFENIFDLWTDVEYLEDFFQNNFNDLMYGYYKVNTVEEAVFRTRSQAESLENKLRELSTVTSELIVRETLDTLFKPLDYNQIKLAFPRSKAYGIPKPSWLRVYAIKLENNKYLVTGGTIKLTKNMDDRGHTKKELAKLNMVLDFLKENGVCDTDGFTELLLDK